MNKILVALVGMKHRGTEALVASLPAGEKLALKREPENRFDPGAVMVFAREQHVGYVKATQARATAVRMDRDADFAARLASGLFARLQIDGGRWPMVEIDE